MAAAKIETIIKGMKTEIDQTGVFGSSGFFPSKTNIIGDKLPSFLVGLSNDTSSETLGIANEKIVEQTISVFVYVDRFMIEGIFSTIKIIDYVKRAIYTYLDSILPTCLISNYEGIDVDFGTKLDEFDKEIPGWYGDISTVKLTVKLTYRDTRS